MGDDRGGTFRQRASAYRSKVAAPAMPTPDELEGVEEKLQGGWTQDKDGIHQYRLLTYAERAERPVGSSIREHDLSKDQREAYEDLCAWFEGKKGDPKIVTLGGYAGTGKSTVISVFARAHSGVRIAYCAFTGKAANVLKQKLRDAGVPSPDFVGTIHRLIYQGKKNGQDEIVAWEKIDFLPYNLIVVDEASMLSEEIYDDLRSYGIPIIAVGDHGQLGPIEGSFNLMVRPNVRLEKVHRQAEGSPIISLATFIREEGELPLRYTSNESVSFIDPKCLRESLQKVYCRELTGLELSNIALLCYTNAKRRMANALVREIRWGIREDDPVREGDLLVCLRNSLGVLYNGMRSRVVSSRLHGSHWFWTHAVFEEDDIEVKASMFRGQFNRNGTISRYEDVEEYGFYQQGWSKKIGLLFDFGYALTVHKSQGSGFKDTFLLYERPNMVDRDEFRRWLYTAITRASERLSIVTK